MFSFCSAVLTLSQGLFSVSCYASEQGHKKLKLGGIWDS